MAGPSNDLSLALSPLLSPLRFASRAGVARLKDLEPLVARVVALARTHASGPSAQSLDRLAAAAEGFDSAEEPQRRQALAKVVRELSALVDVPDDISALGEQMSDPAGTLAEMKSVPAARRLAEPLATPVDLEIPALPDKGFHRFIRTGVWPYFKSMMTDAIFNYEVVTNLY